MRSRTFVALACLSLSVQADIRLSATESYSQEQAREYCRDLGSGWRQMSIAELYAVSSSALFAQGYSYWSSTQIASGDAQIGTGSEGDGGVIARVGLSFYPKERNVTLSPPTKKIAAACTDAPEIQRPRGYVLTKEGTADHHSAVVWHALDATDKKARYTYDQAKEMCENLTLHGRSWRLPSTDELYGIVDYTFIRPTVDMKFFGPVMHRYYWSGDELNEKEAYVVGFKLGSVATASKKEAAYARCVSESE